MLQIQLQNQTIDFHCPNSPALSSIILDIFAGKEYPIIDLPGYVPDVILDIGSNVGATALYFHHYFPQAKIYCFEPSAENYDYLLRNVQDINTIQAFPFGLWDQDCELPLYVGKSQTAQHSLFLNSGTLADAEVVKLKDTTRELVRLGIDRISIVKIDTEGSEVPILSSLLEAISSIDLVYFEFHSEDDRKALDALLDERFLLIKMQVIGIHRGSGAYISKELTQRHPFLEELKISK